MACQILLVEDDSDVRAALADFLESEGFEVVTAANGLEALELLGSGVQPRVILLDLAMPVMDGREFRQRQKADPRIASIPVVAFSAGRDVASLDTQEVMPKPVDAEHLLEVVRKYCG